MHKKSRFPICNRWQIPSSIYSSTAMTAMTNWKRRGMNSPLKCQMPAIRRVHFRCKNVLYALLQPFRDFFHLLFAVNCHASPPFSWPIVFSSGADIGQPVSVPSRRSIPSLRLCPHRCTRQLSEMLHFPYSVVKERMENLRKLGFQKISFYIRAIERS